MPRAVVMEAECIQIFLSAPQRWQHPKHTDEQVVDYKRLIAGAQIGPNFAHATYLVNLASPDPGIRQRSVDNLVATAECCDRAGLAGLVMHIGSGKGQPVDEAEALIVSGLEAVLASHTRCAILLENSAGSGDYLDVYLADVASGAPVWRYAGSATPTRSGLQTLSVPVTLSASPRQAVRAVFRYYGTQQPCPSGYYDDKDDLAFDVGP